MGAARSNSDSFASACYERPRQITESWPHLLAEAALTDTRYPSAACRVDQMKRLDVSMSCRLDSFVDKHPDADPTLHAAQFQLFLYVQNLTQGDDGFGDMLWFGIPVFDNRYPVKDESYQRDGGKADASGKFIYTLPSKACLAKTPAFVKNGRLLAGKDARWVDVRVDVAPWIVYAYQLARKKRLPRHHRPSRPLRERPQLRLGDARHLRRRDASPRFLPSSPHPSRPPSEPRTP